MKVLIAMDSFKGNFHSLKVAEIVERGIRKVYKDASVDKVAIADGGEGTVDAIVQTLSGKYEKVKVTGPMGEPVMAKYGIVEDTTAVIEMAEASGLDLVDEDKRNPLKATTYGTGELILDAIEKGCTKIIMGIGGSATNDGGTGMARALGVKFLDRDGKELEEGGGSLGALSRIDVSKLNDKISDIEIIVACDVTNPLYGEKGASAIFGPQKGADAGMIKQLDSNLKHYSEIVKKDLDLDVATEPGAGAAGGLGYGLVVFCGAKLSKGIDMVLDTIKIEDRMEDVDVVITGEGRVDGQTIYGKVPVGIAARAKKFGKPVYAIAGFADKGAELVYDHGIDAVISSMVGPMTLQEGIDQSEPLIERASERLFRVIKSIKGL